jgi:hypothetical protein
MEAIDKAILKVRSNLPPFDDLARGASGMLSGGLTGALICGLVINAVGPTAKAHINTSVFCNAAAVAINLSILACGNVCMDMLGTSWRTKQLMTGAAFSCLVSALYSGGKEIRLALLYTRPATPC